VRQSVGFFLHYLFWLLASSGVGTEDWTLVLRAKRGDRQACKLLVERYQRRAFAVAYPLLKNEDEAMDVVQDAFVKVFGRIDTFQGNSSFFTWLYRIVKNLCIDRLRARQRRREFEYDDAIERAGEAGAIQEGCLPSTADMHPGRMLARKELAAKTYEALEQLSPDHRTIIILREIEGLSYEEIARIVGCPKGTVMSRLHHARRNMQKYLAPYVGKKVEVG